MNIRKNNIVLILIFGLITASLVGNGTVALAADSSEGWVSIFNGKDLTGWDGDPRFWSVKDGVIRGETTADASPSKDHSYLIWRGDKPGDFELRATFRIQSGNSGVHVRSKELSKWVVSGIQAEVVPTRENMGSF